MKNGARRAPGRYQHRPDDQSPGWFESRMVCADFPLNTVEDVRRPQRRPKVSQTCQVTSRGIMTCSREVIRFRPQGRRRLFGRVRSPTNPAAQGLTTFAWGDGGHATRAEFWPGPWKRLARETCPLLDRKHSHSDLLRFIGQSVGGGAKSLFRVDRFRKEMGDTAGKFIHRRVRSSLRAKWK